MTILSHESEASVCRTGACSSLELLCLGVVDRLDFAATTLAAKNRNLAPSFR